ncbi:MAG: hypothetical protein NW224_30725 [Leptolyngbyaceae cyanobacterium bins.302]|nr:hypothetical protein [Leptolyngbyaceae cyanobacterium bins.302]
MPEKNPLTGKKPRTSAPTASKPPSSGLAPSAPSQVGNFSDSIELPYKVPSHDPNTLIPSDIYNPATSSAPRMKRDEADKHIETYNEMIAAQEVAEAGYSFISSVFKAHTSYQRALGGGFTALKESLSTQRKQVSAATAVVDLNTERLKFARAVQLNQQANIKLNGETTKTGLVQERMDAEISKVKNEIQGLKTQAQQALQKAQALELPA